MKRAAPAGGSRLVIGLDSSTTGVKVLVMDDRGRIITSASRPIPLSSPGPHRYEQNPDHWWRAARLALRDVTARIDRSRIAALAVSNQRETFVPLDRENKPLRPAIIWLDERCKEEVEPFARRVGRKKILRLTGKPVDYAPVVYRLAWMQRHEPQLYKKIRMICDVHAYLVWKLTGAFRTSQASACPLGAFDLSKREWAGPVLSALRLTARQFPSTFRPGDQVGQVSAAAAAATGLAPGTIVAAGGGDGQAAGLGVNALSTDRAYLNLGTAVVAGVYSPRFLTGSAFRTLIACADQGYYCECSLRAGTFAVDWLLRSVMGLDPAVDTKVHRRLEAGARGLPPGADGLFFVPYICGVMNPYWDMDARGTFTGLSSAHGRFHLYRAVLEGIAFEQALALKAVEKATGRPVRELVAMGGGTANKLWLSILAEVTGKAIRLPASQEASALGAGIAAAVAAGLHPDFHTAAAAMTQTGVTVKPDQSATTAYRDLFQRYAAIYPRLSGAARP